MKFMELLIEDYVQIKLRRKVLRLKDLRKTAKNLLDDYLSDRQQKESSSSTLAEKFFKLDPPLHFSMDPFSTNLRFDNIGLNTSKSCCEEYVQNIRIYFNTVLSKQLLFRLERLQYLEIIDDNNNDNNQENNQPMDVQDMPKIRSRKNSDTKNSTTTKPTKIIPGNVLENNQQQQQSKEPIEIYTPIHLLRLFTKYPSYLQYFPCDPNLFRLLEIFNDDFFEFCLENFDEYFGANNLNYYEPTIDYIERSANVSIDNNNEQQQQSSSSFSMNNDQSMMMMMIDCDDNSSTNEIISNQAD